MDNKAFAKVYKKYLDNTFIRCKLTNDEEFNCKDYHEWTEVKEKCEKESLFLKELIIQFRSHPVEIEITDDMDGIYLIRSAMGKVGSKTKNYITFGAIRDGIVYKQMILVPELIIENRYEDKIEDCFEEAILYDKTKKN